MPQTIRNEIEYEEIAEGYSENWQTKQSSVTRILRVAHDDASAFVSDMLGFAIAGAGSITRFLPESHPDFGSLYAVSCDLVGGFGAFDQTGPSDCIRFEKLTYRVTYQSLPYAIREDGDITDEAAAELSRYVERKLDFSVENFTIPPGNTYKFYDATPSNRRAVHQAIPKAAPTQDAVYIWHRVPLESVPFAKINAALGKVNGVAFDTSVDGLNAPKWTMLFVAAEYDRYYGPGGNWEVNLTYRFAYKNNGDDPNNADYQAGWNHIYAPLNYEFRLVSSDGTYTGTPIYEEFDLNTLFTPA